MPLPAAPSEPPALFGVFQRLVARGVGEAGERADDKAVAS